VEHAVRGLRGAEGLHWISAWGIVDKDQRPGEEVARLRTTTLSSTFPIRSASHRTSSPSAIPAFSAAESSTTRMSAAKASSSPAASAVALHSGGSIVQSGSRRNRIAKSWSETEA
jgi:hypothetical protein